MIDPGVAPALRIGITSADSATGDTVCSLYSKQRVVKYVPTACDPKVEGNTCRVDQLYQNTPDSRSPP